MDGKAIMLDNKEKCIAGEKNVGKIFQFSQISSFLYSPAVGKAVCFWFSLILSGNLIYALK